MDEKTLNEQETFSAEEPVSPPRSNSWLWAVMALGFALVVALVLFYREQDSRRQLELANTQLNGEVSQMHDQISDLSARVNALLATPPAPVRAAEDPPGQASQLQTVGRPTVKHPAVKKALQKEDPRWKQFQAQLAENNQKIDATQQQLESNRQEMENNLNSTRDNLNGTIAKTHEELVALEKRGERAYYEFNLSKSKGFDRVGPMSLSLRKTNLKHGYYDVAVLVEDSRLDKKHINLFEPVLFYPSGSHQPLELVVNRIDKNYVQGYVSAPKYKETQRAASPAPREETLTDPNAELPHRPADQQ
jgi:hypothetical protein